ncbi:uncharacterized protein [Nicotiana sylvestris]|uniref:uncharacterized protein n=1 Tax=Nicotiana sylvestris TaxID=4096 RepID=UPI00388CAB78
MQKLFPSSVASKPILKKFRMPDVPKYNGTTDPNEHITAYTCVVKGNDLKDDEIESILLKKFGETLSKVAMMWYHNLPLNSMDSFAMLADSFVKPHTGVIKVDTRKSDVFKIKQRENEMPREFVSRFQMERIELPPVSDDWAVHAFTQGLNEQSSIASKQLKQNLIEYPTVTWADVHNMHQSKIKVEDDQLGAPSGLVYPSRLLVKEPRESKLGKERIEDCRQLQEEVARLINEGHLREFLNDRAKNHFQEREANKKNGPEKLQHIIHMIVGGTDVPQRPMFKRAKVSIATERQARSYIPDDALTFREKDIEALSQPQGLALSQSHYIKKVLDKFKYLDFKIAKIPIDVSYALQKNEGESDSQLDYARVLGSLMYIMNYTDQI